MRKPESIRRVELKTALEAAVTESQLPPYVIEPVLAELLGNIRIASVRQYQADLAQWEEKQKEQESAE